ncbi:hypothetical protein [Vibrio caribbeanicus]|uniref:hypothetical protein n=1 Tax=Vibrio caribbeanicus TaxID=701175 RepID=UPI0030D80534
MIKFNKGIVFSIILSSPFAQAGIIATYGTATQNACVNLLEPANDDMLVQVKQTIWDTVDVLTKDSFFIIDKGQSGLHCDSETISDDIYVNGKVIVNWTVKNIHNGTILATFNTASEFNGEGANNDWNIQEKGQCGSEETPGVYLIAENTHSCGQIIDVPDETTVSAVFVPTLEKADSSTKLIDVSGGLVGSAIEGSGGGVINGVAHKYYARLESDSQAITPYYFSGIGLSPDKLSPGTDYNINVATGLWLGKKTNRSCQRHNKSGVCGEQEFNIGLIPEASTVRYSITYLGSCASTLENGKRYGTPLFSQATLLSNNMNNGLPRARNVRVNRYNSPIANNSFHGDKGDCDINEEGYPVDLDGNAIIGCGEMNQHHKWPQCVKMVDLNDWFE